MASNKSAAPQFYGMNPNTDVCGESMTAKKRGEGYVKLLTHTYLRGTNLQNKVVILDESQNYTVAELKKGADTVP